MCERDNQPTKITVELVSSADVRRLEARDEEIRKEVKQLEDRIAGVHRTLYELIERISRLTGCK